MTKYLANTQLLTVYCASCEFFFVFMIFFTQPRTCV